MLSVGQQAVHLSLVSSRPCRSSVSLSLVMTSGGGGGGGGRRGGGGGRRDLFLSVTFFHFLFHFLLHVLSPSPTFSHFPSRSVTFCHVISLSLTVCHFLSPSVTFHHVLSDRKMRLSLPKLLSTGFGPATPNRTASVDCLVHVHELVVQLHPLLSLITLVDGLEGLRAGLRALAVVPSCQPDVDGIDEGAQRTFFTSSKCQFVHPFADGRVGTSLCRIWALPL